MPDLRSLYDLASSQRATGRTTVVLRGLVASGEPFIYVVHNEVMVRHAQNIIADLRRTAGRSLPVEPIRVFTPDNEHRFIGSRHPIIFDHVCVENFLREATGERPSPRPIRTPPDRAPPPATSWWKRLRRRATWCIKKA